MTIAYPDWPTGPLSPQEQPARTGMAAHLYARMGEDRRHHWGFAAASIAGHVVIVMLALYVSFGMPKKEELQTITVSVSAAQVSQPETPPPPRLERLPQVVQPNLPQIDTAAPPPQAPTETKGAEESPVSAPRFDAGYLNNPAPVYPNMSRRLREVGIVQLRVRVSVAGEPLEILLFKSSGYTRLDDSARAAVQKWKFEPAKRNGAAAEAWVIVPIDFSLTRTPSPV